MLPRALTQEGLRGKIYTDGKTAAVIHVNTVATPGKWYYGKCIGTELLREI
jgi:hypothetical protein